MDNIFRKTICIFISALMLFSLASCGAETDTGKESEAASSEETSAAAEAADIDYISIYRDYLNDVYEENADDSFRTFGLFNIDSDSVPELVISDGNIHASKAQVYTITDGKVQSTDGYGLWGECAFGIGSGIILFGNTTQGIISYGYYKLENGKTDYLWGGYQKAKLDENNTFTDFFDEFYVYENDPLTDDSEENAVQIDSEEFYTELEKYDSQIAVSTTDNGYMYELTADNIEYYTENYKNDEFESRAYETARGNMLSYLNEYETVDDASYYYSDLNGDGYDDIIYYCGFTDPVVAIYTSGDFKENTITSDVKLGSLFPSGNNSGLFFDADKGIVIYRYAGHTEGTAMDDGAEAFKVNGISLESIWVITSDYETYNEKYPDAEDRDTKVSECLADFQATYESKTADYNLTNFFDVCLTAG